MAKARNGTVMCWLRDQRSGCFAPLCWRQAQRPSRAAPQSATPKGWPKHPRAWLGAVPGRRWSALTDAVREPSQILTTPYRCRRAPRPVEVVIPEDHRVTTDQAALFGDYVDWVAETTPPGGPKRGRRQRAGQPPARRTTQYREPSTNNL